MQWLRLTRIAFVMLSKGLLITDDKEPKLAPSDSTPQEYRMADFVRGRGSENVRPDTRSIAQRPPSRYVDVKHGETTTRISAWGPPNRNKALPKINHPDPGQSDLGIGRIPVTGQLFPPMRPEEPTTVNDAKNVHNLYKEWSRFTNKKQKNINAVPAISAPILNEDSSNPLNRIATVDLETAARNEQERRMLHPQHLEPRSLGVRGPSPSIMTYEKMLQRSRSVGERKAVSQSTSPFITKTHLEPIIESGSASVTSSAQLSPGAEDIRQRSPRQPQKPFTGQMPPPLPPLKTPRTVSSPAVPTEQQPQPDAWDLLAVPPEKETEAPAIPPPRSPLRSRPSTSPAARSIATMTRTPQPDGVGRQRRTASTSSRKSRAGDVMFTDPGAPPPIPQKCAQRKDSMHSQATGAEPPPPYKFDGSGFLSPQRAAMESSSVQEPSTTIVSHSPSKPEIRLSIFPPGYSNKASLGSPQQKASPAARVDLPMAPRPIGTTRTAPKTPDPETPHTFNKGQGSPTGQKVFFLREIEYNKPTPTKVVSVAVNKPLPKSPNMEGLSRESVLNRPRPIPRTPETARLLYSYGGFQRREPHRRSMSCSSIEPKKSILHTTALGSPSQLPPLPPIPQDDYSSLRELPNDTKSMTLEDKMDLFNLEPLSPRSSTSRTTRRRSTSMPEMPMHIEMLSVPLPASKLFSEDREGDQTERSTISSVRTRSILNLGGPAERAGMSRSTSKSGPGATQDDGERPEPSRDSSSSKSQGSRHKTKGQASPTSSGGGINKRITPAQQQVRIGGLPTNPRPIQSSIKGFDEPQSRSMDAPEPIGVAQADLGQDVRDRKEASEKNVDNGSVPTVDGSSNDRRSRDPSQDGSSGTEKDIGHDSWHHRIGKECPTFSSRRGTVRSRRGPPPTPLLLNQPTKAVLVQAEPSPLESSEHALDMIEQQLQKLERSIRTSSVAEDQRMTLIADLEKEMGLQENHWQSMRHTIVRDSLSTAHMSPQQAHGMPAAQASLWPKIHEIRKSKLSTEPTKFSDHSESPASTQRNSGICETSNRNSVCRLSNAGNRMSLLTVSHPTTAQLGSPTPPDTDESEIGDEIQIPLVYSELTNTINSPPPSLWRVEVPSPIIFKHTPSLWSPTATASFISPEQPGHPPTPHSRTERPPEPLTIESSQLWTLDKKPQKAQWGGLWGESSPYSPETAPTKKPKALAQKSTRKSKRITTLPDILESPKPLLDKRGTLGIFQFPWGEKSDTGTILPRTFNFGAMPGTMTTGRATVSPAYTPDVPNFGVAEQQASFFDDRDEEDVGDNFSDFDSDADEDDDFDETTLWEIASLLQSDNSNSRTAITLGEWKRSSDQRTSVVASPTESMDSPLHAAIPVVLDIKPLGHAKPKPSLLWKGKSDFFQVEKSQGLPQPDKNTWGSYVDATPVSTRTLKRITAPTSINSRELWSAPRVTKSSSQSLLWSLEQESGHVETSPATNAKDEDSIQLWTAPVPSSHPQPKGLWTASSTPTRKRDTPSQPSGRGMRYNTRR